MLPRGTQHSKALHLQSKRSSGQVPHVDENIFATASKTMTFLHDAGTILDAILYPFVPLCVPSSWSPQAGDSLQESCGSLNRGIIIFNIVASVYGGVYSHQTQLPIGNPRGSCTDRHRRVKEHLL